MINPRSRTRSSTAMTLTLTMTKSRQRFRARKSLRLIEQQKVSALFASQEADLRAAVDAADERRREAFCVLDREETEIYQRCTKTERTKSDDNAEVDPWEQCNLKQRDSLSLEVERKVAEATQNGENVATVAEIQMRGARSLEELIADAAVRAELREQSDEEARLRRLINDLHRLDQRRIDVAAADEARLNGELEELRKGHQLEQAALHRFYTTFDIRSFRSASAREILHETTDEGHRLIAATSSSTAGWKLGRHGRYCSERSSAKTEATVT